MLEIYSKSEKEVVFKILRSATPDVHSALDVFYRPDYLALTEEDDNSSILFLIFRKNEGIVYYPVIIRRIFNSVYNDLISPFEYGGPLTLTEVGKDELLNSFYFYFANFCREKNIVSEFIRLNPFFKYEFLNNNYEVKCVNENYCIRLDDEIKNIISSSKFRDVKNAKNKSVVIDEISAEEDITSLYEIYLETMTRNGALANSIFSFDFFKRIQAFIKSGHCKIYRSSHIERGDLSFSIFLHDDCRAHYFLSGSKKNNLNAHTLLMYQSLNDFKNMGLDTVHFGGGSKSQLGLRKYKESFSNYTVPYKIASKIWNDSIYNSLTLKRKNDIEVDIFPAYRG